MLRDAESDQAVRTIGWTALMVFRGAREEGSLTEAFWATAATMLALLRKEDDTFPE
jgi:hypothetical protein